MLEQTSREAELPDMFFPYGPEAQRESNGLAGGAPGDPKRLGRRTGRTECCGTPKPIPDLHFPESCAKRFNSVNGGDPHEVFYRRACQDAGADQ